MNLIDLKIRSRDTFTGGRRRRRPEKLLTTFTSTPVPDFLGVSRFIQSSCSFLRDFTGHGRATDTSNKWSLVRANFSGNGMEFQARAAADYYSGKRGSTREREREDLEIEFLSLRRRKLGELATLR